MTGDGGYWYPLSTAEFFVQFINDTPDVQGNQVTVSFTSNMPLASATCRTQPSREENCKHMGSYKHAMFTLATIAMSAFIHSLTPDHQSLIIIELYFHRYKSNCSFRWATSKKATPIWSQYNSHIDIGPVCHHYQTVPYKWEIGLPQLYQWSLILHFIMHIHLMYFQLR